MTVTIKSEDVGKYNIEISQDKFTSVYKVALNRCVGDYYVTDNERLYGTRELLRLIEVGASCFNHYCVDYDDA